MRLLLTHYFEGLPLWVAVSAMVVMTYAAAFLVAWLVMAFARWRAKRHATALYRFDVERLKRPLYTAMPVLAVFVAIRIFWPELMDGDVVITVTKFLTIVLIYWLALCAIDIVSVSISRRHDITVRDNLKARRVHTQIMLARRLATFLLVVLTLAAIFLLFDELRGLGVSLLASAGVAGIVIGFAAQKTLGNLLAGIQIAITQPIRLEDAVVVEGEWGWVEEITLTYVVVRIWDLRRLVLPIGYFIEKPFQNWTRTSASIIGTVELYADYSLPVEPLRAHLLELLAKTDLWDQQVQVVQMTETYPDVVKIRILVSAADSPTAFDLRCYVRENMVAFINARYPEALPKTRAVVEEAGDAGRKRLKADISDPADSAATVTNAV
ncbi:mechanosensitive ion channel family protein [Asticcacaulis sp. BYS171W]|uniref:Mechanosensitive ion channel family protein n=1 Tax=Asticcacaulis aquaticus TaxID=2984212 RepID=A0ABT5HQK5_9CAUL|nr:mechanosensitive ion channel family protein [Asticcacaulis aquaticus]MDC7682269.1 mechanosensitive ion channel family protein [Asticcacaulis aquaticus]